MQAREFWRVVTVDKANLLDRLIEVLDTHGIRYCVIGGQGVNAYVDPLVSLDLDLAVATEQLERVESLVTAHFQCERFPHSLNVSLPGSGLRVQIQRDPRYGEFVERARPRSVLQVTLPVAAVEDVLQGKVWAAQDPDRRPTKRQKDLLDITRLIESYPALRDRVPADLLARLL